MKRFFALIIIFTIALITCFYSKSTCHDILKAQGIEIQEFDYNSKNEILIFNNSYLDKIIDSLILEIYFSKEISDRVIIEGYSNKLSDYVIVNNLKINIQIAIDDEKIILGYPLIDGSF